MELEIVLELLIQPVAPPTAQSTFNNYSEGKCTTVGWTNGFSDQSLWKGGGQLSGHYGD